MSCYTNWTEGEKREYTFVNNTYYRYYGIYITANNGSGFIVIGEAEMMEGIVPTATPTPTPEPTLTPTHTLEPTPTPVQSSDAILIITMINGLRMEYDMTGSEVSAFKAWYGERANGTGDKYYIIDKEYNKGPFTSRKDYIAFDKIMTFEVQEY